MEHDVAALHRLAAGGQVTDVALDEPEVRSGLQGLDIMEETRGQVVQAGHVVTFPDEMFAQVASDESGAAGDEQFHGYTIFCSGSRM